jgi:hypothetical protein
VRLALAMAAVLILSIVAMMNAKGT